MKITVLDGYALNPGDLSWDALRALGDVTVYDRTPDDRIIERIGASEAVFTNKVPLDEATLNKCPSLKFVGVTATGYNVIDTVAAKKLGITVCNVPEYSTDAVAEFTFALILEAAHHAGAHNEAVKSGEWTKSRDFCFWKYPLFELSGKTLGIVGYGKIGSAAAKIAEAFGMNVLAYSRSRRHTLSSDKICYADLDEVYKKSDILSLHVPLSSKNKHMINKNSISKMKNGVIIINTARGALVDEADICAELTEKKVACYAADVAEQEPINADSPLLKSPNTILTPHIAWASKEARGRLMETSVENLKAYIEGAPQNKVY